MFLFPFFSVGVNLFFISLLDKYESDIILNPLFQCAPLCLPHTRCSASPTNATGSCTAPPPNATYSCETQLHNFINRTSVFTGRVGNPM